MPAISRFVQLKTVQNSPVEAGGVRLTPESQILSVRLPFGGFVWQRPTAVVLEQAGRATRRVPIVDLTRLALIGVVLATLVAFIATSRQPQS
jgi:hypothetical protein